LPRGPVNGVQSRSCKDTLVISDEIVCLGAEDTKEFDDNEINCIYFIADCRIIEGHRIAEPYDVSWSYEKVGDTLNVKIHPARTIKE